MKSNGKNVLLLSPYRGHRAGEHLKLLESLKLKGLVKKIVVLDSKVGAMNYPFEVDSIIDREVRREFPEAARENPELFLKYCEDLKQVFSQENIDLVIPTSDKEVFAVASSLPSENTACPSLDMVNLFQNKGKTYDFIKKNKIFRTPSYLIIKKENLDPAVEFLFSVNGEAFAKPLSPQRGGSVGVGKVNSVKELENLIDQSPIKGDYLLTDLLSGLEKCHSMIISSKGGIVTQATYECSGGRGNLERTSVEVEELDSFGENFGHALSEKFLKEDFSGVYNADFLKDKEGNFVLSEINPGRLPAGLGVFRDGKYNLLEATILSGENPGFVYDKKATLNNVYFMR